MRKILWTVLLLCGYFWLVTSGKEAWVLETGKAVYKSVAAWFDDAELDFQVHKDEIKKRSRRWD